MRTDDEQRRLDLSDCQATMHEMIDCLFDTTRAAKIADSTLPFRMLKLLRNGMYSDHRACFHRDRLHDPQFKDECLTCGAEIVDEPDELSGLRTATKQLYGAIKDGDLKGADRVMRVLWALVFKKENGQ